MVDRAADLQVKPNVSLALLPVRQPIRLNIGLAQAVDKNKEDVCLTTNGSKVPGNAAQEHRAVPSDSCSLSYFAVNLDKHYLAAEALKASLDH